MVFEDDITVFSSQIGSASFGLQDLLVRKKKLRNKFLTSVKILEEIYMMRGAGEAYKKM